MKIICLCGSMRFKETFQEVELAETLRGNMVLLPQCFHTDLQRDGTPPNYKELVDLIHLKKIQLADEIIVINVEGYMGESTRKEILWAQTFNKPIKYIENTAAKSVSKAGLPPGLYKGEWKGYEVNIEGGIYDHFFNVNEYSRLRNRVNIIVKTNSVAYVSIIT